MGREILQFVRFAHVVGEGKAFKELGAIWTQDGWLVPAAKEAEAESIIRRPHPGAVIASDEDDDDDEDEDEDEDDDDDEEEGQ